MAKKVVNFENNLLQLQDIVQQLDSTSLSLTESVSLYEKGISLYLKSLEYIQKIDLQIETLNNKAELASEKSSKPIFEKYQLLDNNAS